MMDWVQILLRRAVTEERSGTFPRRAVAHFPLTQLLFCIKFDYTSSRRVVSGIIFSEHSTRFSPGVLPGKVLYPAKYSTRRSILTAQR